MKPADIDEVRQLAERYVADHGGGRISGILGDGGSAAVFRWDTDSASRALKVYDPKFFNSSAAPAERRRLELQRRLIGKPCQSLIDILAVEEAHGTCFLTMELFEGHELKHVIGRVPDAAVGPLIQQLVDAVRFLENVGLVHRDIKPENILVSNDFQFLKLIDLGVVREISSDEDRVDGTDHGDKRPFIATAQYSSPEYLFRLEAPSDSLWKALTIYQVGAVLHDLVCKRVLFEKAVAADNKYALAMAVLNEPPSFEGASPEVAEWSAVAARCLTKQSSVRLKTVNWDDFYIQTESAANRLKRALTARAAYAESALEAETLAQVLLRYRERYVGTFLEAFRQRVLAEYSPQVRLAVLSQSGVRSVVLLSLADQQLRVKFSFEFSWETGLREKWGTVRLAAQTVGDDNSLEQSGERRIISEVFIDDEIDAAIVRAAFEASSEILVKHSAMLDTGAAVPGIDMIVATWPK